MQDPPGPQQDPAQIQPATGGTRRRPIIAGPAVGMLLSGAAAVPVAGATGWRPTWVTAILVAFAVSAVWFAASTAARRRGDSDRDRIRGEASLRQALADVALRQDVLLTEARRSNQLNWRILHVLRQQKRRGQAARAMAEFGLRFGRITHRVEQVEALVEQERMRAQDELNQMRRELAEHFVDQLHGGFGEVRRIRPRS